MLTMYDSTQPSLIPAGAEAVAGYVDGRYKWTQADWDRFTNAKIKLRITTWASLDADYVDCEHGDATPDSAFNWIQAKRVTGCADAGVYADANNWDKITHLFDLARLMLPPLWLAKWDGVAELPPNCMAKQYQSLADYDLSIVRYPMTLPDQRGNMNCLDPKTGGVWIVDPTDGHVECDFGAPYLGGLNEPTPDRYNWQQVGMITGITPYRDPNNEWGYAIVLKHFKVTASGAWYSFYTFMRNGSNIPK